MIALLIVFFLIAPIGISFGGFVVLRRRLEELEELARQNRPAPVGVREFEALRLRVSALEKERLAPAPEMPVVRVRTSTPAPVVEPLPENFTKIVEPPPTNPTPIVYVPPIPAWSPEPILRDRIQGWLRNEEWEALVGGSLLNKVGAVVLVVGIALFLGYSFGHVGPVGRATTSILLSVGLLAGGVRAEARPRFKVFGRGLIGAGWAAMYATAYAIYAVPATRIIGNPVLGSVVLLAVACGMIAHSLRYRVQAVTGITYFAAFAALAITPATPLALLSLIPLAASVLYLAWRFDWYGMALFGAVATYLTCVSKGDAGAPLASSQGLLLAYWLLFEGFDWLRMKGRKVAGGVEWVGAANAAGFLGVSYLAWQTHAPGELWLASAYGAGLYVTSAAVRLWLRPMASFGESEELPDRLRTGSFEGSALVAAVLAGMAVFGRVQGVWSSFGLAMEAEVICLAGVILGSAFLRGLGSGWLGLSLLELAWAVDGSQRTEVMGHAFRNWSPGALLHAGLFYINREIRRGTAFGVAASALVAVVIGFEVSAQWLGLTLALFGATLLAAGLYRKVFEFRAQGYVLAAAGFMWTSVMVLTGGAPWIPLAVCTCLACGMTGTLIAESRRAETAESVAAAQGSAFSVVGLAALLLWRIVPVDYLGLAWYLLAAAVLEAGLGRLANEFRRLFLPMAGLAAVGVAMTHGEDLAHFPPFATWATYAAGLVCSVWSAGRLSRQEARPRSPVARDLMCCGAGVFAAVLVWLVTPEPLISLTWMSVALLVVELARRLRWPVLVWLAVFEAVLAYGRVMFVDLGSVGLVAHTVPVFIAGLYWMRFRLVKIGRQGLALGIAWAALGPYLALTQVKAGWESVAAWWMAGALGLLVYGAQRADRDFRLQGYCMAALALGAALWFDLSPVRLANSLPVVAGLYVARIVLAEEQEDRHAPICFSLGGTLLLAGVLFEAVSGSMLTVAWGLEGVGLLGIGFALRNRELRLQGLGLVLGCTLKLFLYDLRNLETPFRILSFIVLGLMLLGVSWVYSRFREQLRRIL